MPDDPAPPIAPVSRGPAPTGMVPARWHYVDEARAHEVHAGVRPGARAAFVVKESAYQNDDASEIVAQEIPLEAPWEAQLHHWQLESRLAALGRYWKNDAANPGWRALVRPQGAPELDLREVAVSPYRGRIVFHHFHHRAREEECLLVGAPTPSARGRRWLLARAAFRFPEGAEADVALLHAHLPDAPARSVIAREHLLLKEKGFEKLVWAPDYLRAHGADWAHDAGRAFAEVLRRISEGRFGPPAAAPSAPEDAIYTDYLHALTDPRLLEIQARFLSPEEQEEALAGGEGAIRRLVARKREGASSDDQLKLTLLEASLLARDQLRPGQRARVDPEVAALVRRFAYYL